MIRPMAAQEKMPKRRREISEERKAKRAKMREQEQKELPKTQTLTKNDRITA